MTESQHQIDYITSNGTIRLLDIGVIVAEDPAISVQQQTRRYTPLGAEWGEAQSLGGGEPSARWTAVRNHASHADLHSYCMRHAASLPSWGGGTLRVTVSGGEVWDIEDAVVYSAAPIPLAGSAIFETVTSYAATGGRMVPAAAIDLYAGIPWVWILQDWDDLTGDWDDL